MKYIFILLGLFPVPAYAQPGFNQVYDLGFSYQLMRDMVVHNDTVVGYGIAQLDSTLQQVILLTQFDSSGNLLNWDTIADPTGDFYSMGKSWGKITHSQGGGYALTAAPLAKNAARLIKVNGQLETEFIKEYFDPGLASNFAYQILEVENGYLLYGRVQDSNLVARPFIRRIDSHGEVLWDRYYGNPDHWGNMVDITLLNDTIIVGANVHATTTNVLGPSRNELYFVRPDGTLLYEWHSGPNPEMGFLRKVKVTESGELLLYGMAIVGQNGGSTVYQSTFSLMDAYNNIQWIKNYGRTGSLQITFRDIEPTLDGQFIAAGESFATGPGDQASGWIMKLSPSGDSTWSRYDVPLGSADFFGDNYFSGVGVLSSGNIIAGGTAGDGSLRPWLVKVTADGCMEVIDCGLVPAVGRGAGPAGFVIYPNPASGGFTVQMGGAREHGGRISMYGPFGDRVLTARIERGADTVRIGTEGIPNGLYFLYLENNEKVAVIGKVTVNHSR